jgi:3-oxoacyl-[acyl-carrier-protein] synthase III
VRRVAEQDVNPSDLALEASLNALDMAGMTAKDLWRRK